MQTFIPLFLITTAISVILFKLVVARPLPIHFGDRIEVEKYVGAGAEGEIFFVKDLKDGQSKAMKIFFDFMIYREIGDLKHFDQLCRFSTTESHIVVPLEKITIQYKNTEKTALLYERMQFDFAKKDIEKYENSEGYSVSELQTLVSDILIALSNLRKLGLSHGDFKRNNILIRDGRYYISDLVSLNSLEDNLPNDLATFGEMLYYLDIFKFEGNILKSIGDISKDDNLGGSAYSVLKTLFPEHEVQKYMELMDLIQQLRSPLSTPEKALKHPFLSKQSNAAKEVNKLD